MHLLIAGSILLLFVLATFYNRNRRRRQEKLLLKAQQDAIRKSNQRVRTLAFAQKKLIAEKEGLLREIHHRVRNNLQMVISLLNMQTKYLKDDKTLRAFGDISNRMFTISIIHQNLYDDDNITVIDIREYISELLSFLTEEMKGIEVLRIRTDIDPIDLDISQSVAVGLILNEAINTTVRYAQVRKRQGNFYISMKDSLAGQITLALTEEGIDLPEDCSRAENPSLGFSLIKLLALQLEGEVAVWHGMGPAEAVRHGMGPAEAVRHGMGPAGDGGRAAGSGADRGVAPAGAVRRGTEQGSSTGSWAGPGADAGAGPAGATGQAGIAGRGLTVSVAFRRKTAALSNMKEGYQEAALS